VRTLRSGKLKLWVSEIVALTSTVPWLLLQFLWENEIDIDLYREFSSGILLFLAVALIPAFYDNLKNGYKKPNIKSIFYVLLFLFPILAAAGNDPLYNPYLYLIYFFQPTPAYFTLLVQLLLSTAACIISFFTKEFG